MIIRNLPTPHLSAIEKLFFSVLSLGIFFNLQAQQTLSKEEYETYCNPIDIDYTYMSHYRGRSDVSYRSGADPAIVNFKGKYYLFDIF